MGDYTARRFRGREFEDAVPWKKILDGMGD
jgi:hypothetical protein